MAVVFVMIALSTFRPALGTLPLGNLNESLFSRMKYTGRTFQGSSNLVQTVCLSWVFGIPGVPLEKEALLLQVQSGQGDSESLLQAFPFCHDVERDPQLKPLLGFQCFPDCALLAYFFQRGSIITTHSSPCTPGPAGYFVMLMLKEKVSAYCVSSFGSRDFPWIWKE